MKTRSEIVDEQRGISPWYSVERKSDIVEEFREFWAGSPTEEEFVEFMVGIDVRKLPQILFIMSEVK